MEQILSLSTKCMLKLFQATGVLIMVRRGVDSL